MPLPVRLSLITLSLSVLYTFEDILTDKGNTHSKFSLNVRNSDGCMESQPEEQTSMPNKASMV